MRTRLERWLPPDTPPSDTDDALQALTLVVAGGELVDARPSRAAPPVEPPLEPLDVAMLTRSFGSRETLCLVAEDLLANLPADLDELRRSEEGRDAERMGRALHRITGALGTFGYRNLAAELRVATRTAEDGDLVAPEEIARLLRRIEGTLSDLGEFVAKNKADVD